MSEVRERLTIRHAFCVSRTMDADLRRAASEDAGKWEPISVSDWIRGAIEARLKARQCQEGMRVAREPQS